MAQVSPEMVTALGGIVLGLAPIAAGLIGKRGAATAEATEPPPQSADPATAGLALLVDNLQEERDRAHTELAEARRENGELRAQVARLRQTITDLGGFP